MSFFLSLSLTTYSDAIYCYHTAPFHLSQLTHAVEQIISSQARGLESRGWSILRVDSTLEGPNMPI